MLKILFTEAPAEMHRKSNIGLKYIYKGANTKTTQISFKYRHGKQEVFNYKKSLAKGDYPTLSQKFMRGAAAKYIVFWMQWLMRSLVHADPSPADNLLHP